MSTEAEKKVSAENEKRYREDAIRKQIEFLQKELDKDPVRSKAVDFTKLNLMEITRQRKELPLGAVYPERTGEKDHEL